MFKLLPLFVEAFKDVDVEIEYTNEMSYHPSPEKVLDGLITQYIVGMIFGALVQSYASENNQRMTAMDNATRNADEMLTKRHIKLNRVRQQSITSDLSEIVGAMEALNLK